MHPLKNQLARQIVTRHAQSNCAVTRASLGVRQATLVLSAFLLASYSAYGVQPETDQAAPAPCSRAHVDIEELNYLGADLTIPSYSDTITGADNPLRHAMLCDDLTYRVVGAGSFAASPLGRPAQASPQVYVGEHPTWTSASYFFLTADLRSIHLAGYQLNTVAIVSRTSWYPDTLEASKMLQAVLYKPFFHKRLEIKAGYQNSDDQFVGMQVGGNASSGSEGVFAVPQNEIGLAFSPLSAPSVTVRVQPKGDFYAKGGLQRSSSPAGGAEDLHRDAAGFRFAPQGDGLLSLFEGGYKRDAQPETSELWIRGGFMSNTTRYPNARTNTNTSGNRCWFLLADHQLRAESLTSPRHGLYAGISAISVPPELNAYPAYYELRFYQVAPFRSRPNDLASVVFSHTAYSSFTRAQLIAAGKTTASSLSTAMGSYSARLQRGIYLSAGVAYNNRPAITPRLPGAFTATVQTMLFF